MQIDIAPNNKTCKRLNGFARGQELRAKYNLDALDLDQHQTIFVNIPPRIFSMDISFFNGMFRDSVKRLGSVGFNTKYQFIVGNRLRTTIQQYVELTIKFIRK